MLPPGTVLFDSHIVLNTPYILVGVTERMLASYLDREVGRIGARKLPGKMEAPAYIMKYAPTPNHWNEYIFCAYTGEQHEAAFSTGIPYLNDSLPRVSH